MRVVRRHHVSSPTALILTAFAGLWASPLACATPGGHPLAHRPATFIGRSFDRANNSTHPSFPLPSFNAAMTALVPLVTWVGSHKWLVLGSLVAATPIIGFLQGTYFLIRYRLQYGEAPCPLLPSFGVVIADADTEESNEGASEQSEQSKNFDITDPSGKTRIWGSISTQRTDRIRRGMSEPALRLLVIGDSLAAGVGVLGSACPVLPEVIARSLSKHLGGRPVYYTCVAEPGASSGWIVRTMDKFQSSDDTSSSDSTERSFTGETHLIEDNSTSFQSNEKLVEEWCSRLSIHSRRLRSEILAEYDVAIVMTGLNDLKGAVLPFLLQGDEIQFRKEAHERGGNYTSELKRVVEAVSTKMKEGLRESLSTVRVSAAKYMNYIGDKVGGSFQVDEIDSDGREGETVPIAKPLKSNSSRSIENKNLSYDSLLARKEENTASEIEEQFPLVVLPALPSNLPVLQWPPFIWCLMPLLRWTDRIKRKLANRYPGAISFVGAPSVEVMKEFERRRGVLWSDRHGEHVILSLQIGPNKESYTTEATMNAYYCKHAKDKSALIDRMEEKFGNLFDIGDEVIFPANTKPDAPGASLLAADGIHPNSFGYDLWGRIIANEIMKKWRHLK